MKFLFLDRIISILIIRESFNIKDNAIIYPAMHLFFKTMMKLNVLNVTLIRKYF
jgi:hypothetical protein